MKVKVLKRFIDKETRQMHEPGETFELTESRLKEIQAAGDFIEVIKATRAKKTAEK